MSASRPSGRLTILDLILLIGGASVGLWIFLGVGSRAAGPPALENSEKVTALLIFLLGGLSIVGPPILLWQRWKGGRRLGPGELLWFCQGTASWLLWPPIVYQRTQVKQGGESMAAVCYFYGTPMMALFVTISLVSGGWIRRRRRRRRTGHEVLGLLIGLAWACTGVYILSLIYRNDLK
jgi:hypothetical protein